MKNEPPEDSAYYPPSAFTHKLLRVMESVKAADGNDAAERLYWQYGAVLHHDRVGPGIDFAEVIGAGAEPFLEAAGLDTSHASAFDDDAWDEVIRDRMNIGLDLVGTDVGTPIIAFESDDGPIGIFGPVISRIPPKEDSLALWDAMVTMATMQGFWELKRTRTEDPIFPDRPA